MRAMIKPFAAILGDIKVQHTIFALPFALMSAFIAADGAPGWRLVALIVVAMVFVRSAAMAFNRLADAKFDRDNPRTAGRALPLGKATRFHYALFVIASSAAFIAVCAYINPLALKLAPFALGVVFFYSLTKRFTAYSHIFLGVALALAPIGAWVAVKEEFAAQPILLGLAVVFWLSGLDTIYSCQDAEFDKRRGLNSIPQKFGVPGALRMSAMFHMVMISFLLALAAVSSLHWLYIIGVALTAALLWYEHSLVRPDDLSRVNVAFFNVNGIISVGLMGFTIADVMLF